MSGKAQTGEGRMSGVWTGANPLKVYYSRETIRLFELKSALCIEKIDPRSKGGSIYWQYRGTSVNCHMKFLIKYDLQMNIFS